MVMESSLIARIGPNHRRRLAWFEEHEGQVSGFPRPLEDGLLLVSAPKGIYKPEGLPYAVSIRINLGSPYQNRVSEPVPGGGWLLSYHQEGDNLEDLDRLATNRALKRCMAEQIPVGVLRELAPEGGRSRYDVLGLALPVNWSDGYFFLRSMDPPPVPDIDVVNDLLEATAVSETENQSQAQEPPADDYDARRRTYRNIVARRGQPAFRRALFDAYDGRCAITGCDATAALEAAHLRPYRGPDSNLVSNGLPLRADIHTLLDLRLIAIEPDTRAIVASKILAGTQYQSLSTCHLREPAAKWQRPKTETLARAWQEFIDLEDIR
jgi:putative restriction endonuclease